MAKSLIISPQSGFGNRLRAISSAIVLAKQCGRKIYHAWAPMTPNENRPLIAPLQKYGYGGFFEQNDNIPLATKELFPYIDVCFSEWSKNDYWYKFQSAAQERFPVIKSIKESNPAKDIYNSMADTILVETSLSMRLDERHGGCDTDRKFNKELNKAYNILVPKKKYIRLLDQFKSVDMGISIRRKDLLNYFMEANQDLDRIREWILYISNGKKVSVFSDDTEVRRNMEDAIPDYNHAVSKMLGSLPSHESSFMQFLYLAQKCNAVYGTPASSFAREAAIFGGRPYNDNLTTIKFAPGTISKSKKDIYIFFHICCINNYMQVANEMIDELTRSGLYDKCKKIFYSLVGDPSDDLKKRIKGLEKFELVHMDRDISGVEYPILISLEDFCKKNDCYILYIHTKGVSLPKDDFRQNWRRRLLRKVITENETCISLLNEGCDIAGCGWKEKLNGRTLEEVLRSEGYMAAKHSHYSGNLWWADSAYIRKLPSMAKIREEYDRYKKDDFLQYRTQCEFWIGMHEHIMVGVNGEFNKEYSNKNYHEGKNILA